MTLHFTALGPFAKQRSVLLLSVFICCLLLSVRTLGQQPPINALVIYGSGGIANWDQGFNQNLRNELGPNLGQYFTPETLALISTDAAEQELIAQSLAMKHSNKEISLVVAVLAEANTFVSDWGHVFAPNAAILRVLPPDEMLQQAGVQPNTVILASAIDAAITKTTDLLPDFFPELKQIYLIGGAGAGDQVYMQRYQSVLSGLNLPYEFRVLTGLPPNDLIAELSMSQENAAVMTTTYDIDSDGRPMRSLLITQQMARELDMPVLSLSDPQVPAGAIGGNVTTIEAYARTAARLIRGIIQGDYPTRPVTADTVYMFNGEQLDRFKIDRSLLPLGSTIVNDSPNLWRDYYHWILIGVAIIAIQGLLIAGLLDARRRRRLAEESLVRAHKMEALGSLAGGIAHDFNNILMSITANTELVSFRTESDKDTQNHLEKILSASNRAKGLITQILMFNRQSASSERKPLDVYSLVNESSEQLRAILPSSCVLRITGSKAPMQVDGDALQLYQVLMNLCVNAQQAMENKGVITIDVQSYDNEKPRTVRNQLIAPGSYAVISVSDIGAGISEDNLQHIFEPFYTTKAQGKGTGLGLALVYQIVKSHHGVIDVESQLGHGTKVTLYFPARSELAAQQIPDEPLKVVRGKNENILLVDDDELVLDANERVLTVLGYQVTSFSSSVSALKEFNLQPERYDLVFSDLSMPEMDGMRLISNIRKSKPDAAVILCTGYLDALEPGDLGGIQVLRKPSTAAEIARVVKLVLGDGIN